MGAKTRGLAIGRVLVHLEDVPARPVRTAALRAAETARRGAAAFMLAALTVGTLSGCRPLYVAKVGIQHLRYISRARPISEEITKSSDPVRRHRLELVLQARDFAAANGLAPGGSYLKVADTAGLSAGYVVTAARRDRLEPYEWSYPVIGKIPYRGYFERASADAFAKEMEADGYDTYVFPAAGYSTLGWFDDPLPSNALRYADPSLVELVIHELVHQNVFVNGEIAFNETLASGIAKRLTIQFFREREDETDASAAERSYQLWLAQSDVFDRFAERLKGFYAASAYDSRIDLVAERAVIYRELEETLAPLEKDPTKPDIRAGTVMNNAVFLSLWGYRKQAVLIRRYLDSFDSMPEALDDLREWAKSTEADPYASLQAHLASRNDDETASAVSRVHTAMARPRLRVAHAVAAPTDGAQPGHGRLMITVGMRPSTHAAIRIPTECCSRESDMSFLSRISGPPARESHPKIQPENEERS